jgi:hypothetical protein
MTMTAEGRYTQLASLRQPFLDRARDCAKLTIPTLVPPDGAGSTTKYYTPFQSLGSSGVNNLANKLLLALLPPNTPFFKLLIDDFMVDKVAGQPGMRGEIDKALNKIERSVMTEIEASAIRVSSFEALKQLLVAGNALAYLPTEGGQRVFRLDRYVVHRDPMGNVLEIITKEDVSPDVLPLDIQTKIKQESPNPEKTVSLFTRIRRVSNKWEVIQEAKGMIIPGSKGSYPLDKSPWIPLRWTRIDGEDYGRGYVEQYFGDLRSLEALMQAIVEGSAAAAKVLFLVNPNGTTSIKSITDSENGAVRAGNKEDVTVLQMEKFADFRIAHDTISVIEQRLGSAFLLTSAMTRDAERVTAEEIRMVATELEQGLGGAYSILSQEYQQPMVTRIMFQMERQKRLPVLPKGMVRPAITTGLEALGRGHDQAKLTRFLSNIAPLGPEVIAQYLNISEYIKRAGVSEGIEMDGLVRSDEEIAQAQQQAQMQQMMETLGPKGMDIVRDQMDPSKNGQAAQVPPEAANG